MSQFSNENKDVFLIKPSRMIDRGALISRYSRTATLDIRDLYRKEFEHDETRGADFYKRVFLEYGDESVAELVTAQMGLQNISNIATKVIEESRIGLSFIEKSSRYVRYDKKVNGRYLFATGDKIGISGSLKDLYEDHCEALFDTYSEMYSEVKEEVRKSYPIDNFVFMDSQDGKNKQFSNLVDESDIKIAEKSYESSVRAKVLDEIRFLLPASTLTNMGVTGNGRAFISLLQRLKNYGLPETTELSDGIYRELKDEFPELIDASFSKHGQDLLTYLDALNGLEKIQVSPEEPAKGARLVSYDEELEAINRIIIMSYFDQSENLDALKKKVEGMAAAEKVKLIRKLANLRENRRQKPGRPFESTLYTFQVNTNYGAFRDFQRHRMVTILREHLSTAHGYDIPEIISLHSELLHRYIRVMDLSRKVYQKIKEGRDAKTAQYVVPYGFRYPITAVMNLRELTYFIELRSTPQAHEDLRNIAIQMYDAVSKVQPDLVQIIRFVDREKHPLGRVAAESRKQGKIRDLEQGGMKGTGAD